RFYLRHHPANRAHPFLPSRLPEPAVSRHHLPVRVPDARHVGAHPVLHHPYHLAFRVLDSGDFHDRFHHLLFRIFSRRPDVSRRYHAGRHPGRVEMAPLLLRTLLPYRHLHGTPPRRRDDASSCDSVRLASLNVGRGSLHVEARPGTLSSRWRLNE